MADIKKIPDGEFTIKNGERGPIVNGSYKGIHLSIFPRGDKGDYEVHITGEKPDGKADFMNDFNSTIIDANPEDVPEAADMYMRRIVSGIKPEDMFRDQEEKTIEGIHESLEKMKQS